MPFRLVLARTDDLALALGDVVAYSTGFSVRLALRLRPDSGFEPRVLMPQLHGFGPPGGDDQLRFGVEFADGRRATNLTRRPPHEQEPEISLVPAGGGGGGGRSFNVGYWVYPLPPPGPLVVAVEWPSRNVREQRYELDAAQVAEAGAASERLWEDDRPISGPEDDPPPRGGRRAPGR